MKKFENYKSVFMEEFTKLVVLPSVNFYTKHKTWNKKVKKQNGFFTMTS